MSVAPIMMLLLLLLLLLVLLQSCCSFYCCSYGMEANSPESRPDRRAPELKGFAFYACMVSLCSLWSHQGTLYDMIA